MLLRLHSRSGRAMLLKIDEAYEAHNMPYKPCCNDLCEVALLKELVDKTVERDYTKATNASVHKKCL